MVCSLNTSCFFLAFFTLCLSLTNALNHYVIPNFTGNNIQFIDNSGAFLESLNGNFRASITSLTSADSTQPRFYFSVIHVVSNTIIWSANRDVPISDTSLVSLTINGLSIIDESNSVAWSTPSFNTSVSSLKLLESGSLVLIDAENVTLWSSFDSPTDTLITGQRLHVGQSLTSALGSNDLAVGDYMLQVTSEDLVMQWKGETYWKLSMESKAYKNSYTKVSYLEMSENGLCLFGANGSKAVFQVFLEHSDMKIARLGYEGIFSINGFMGSKLVEEFVMPDDVCQLPFTCGRLRICYDSIPTCICPTGFHNDANQNNACVPMQDNISLPSSSCNASEFNSSTVYLELQKGLDYFGNHFNQPVYHVMTLSLCQALCSKDCSCLGIFYENASGSCYLLEFNLGSLMPMAFVDHEGLLGYLKAYSTVAYSTVPVISKNGLAISSLVVILIFSGFFITIILVMIIIWLRRRRTNRMIFRRFNSSSTADHEIASIPGLPVRFSYEELVEATENFSDQIGSGGFGTVYKGAIADKSIVAVKKMNSLGERGKMDFCNETASIGSIHHVNLVKLRGFCIHGKQRFLVYDYMTRGSLEKILFGNESSDGPVLEWEKRYKIALGMARGFAYLHSGCQHKIIHCDIKPENILLHSDFQVKITDFGLAKLLSHENSKLLTTLSGTRGYLAPEWLTSHGITDKTDVYSYGMVLLELVRGKRNSFFQCSSTEGDASGENGLSLTSTCCSLGVMYFPLLALEMHKQRRYVELIDPRLEGQVKIEEVETLVRVALSCLHIVPKLRPSMTDVVAMLEGRLLIREPRLEALEFLKLYGGKITATSKNAQ